MHSVIRQDDRRSANPRESVGTGFTMIELLVTAGVLSLLLSLTVPAVQKTREAARQTQCKNNLKQLAMAVHHFESTEAKLPPYDLGDGWATWATLVLPYLDQSSVYSGWNLKLSYYSQSSACSLNGAVFQCPSRTAVNRGSGDKKVFLRDGLRTGPFGPSDYACSAGTEIDAADGSFVRAHSRSTRRTVAIPLSSSTTEFPDPVYPIGIRDLTDGLSNTLLLGEKHLAVGETDTSVFNGDEFRGYRRACGPALGLAPSSNYSEVVGRRLFGSAHSGVCNFALADGSVRSISLSIDRLLLGWLATRAGGEAISDTNY